MERRTERRVPLALLLMLWTLQLVPSPLLAQTTTPGSSTSSSSGWTSPTWKEEVKTMEESVLGSILQIVDRKFDTLSERLSSMERALHGLQFYQVRQFRGAQGSLQSVSANLQAVSSQVTQLSADSQSAKMAISDLSQQVKVGQMASSDRADDLERAVLYINKNLNQKTESVTEALQQRSEEISRLVEERADDVNKNVIKRAQEVSDKLIEVAELVNKNVDEEAEDLRVAVELAVLTMDRDTSTSSRQQSTRPTPQTLVYGPREVAPRTCDLDLPTLEVTLDTKFQAFTRHSDSRLAVRFRDMSERVDMLFRSRFDEFAEFADRHVEKLVNRTQCVTDHSGSPAGGEVSSAGEAASPREEVSTTSTTASTTTSEATTAAPSRTAASPLTGSPAGNIPGDEGGVFKGLLSNLTVNVIQAVSFFRHTGEMMERILSNSETLAEEQARIRRALIKRTTSLPFPQPQPQQYPRVEGGASRADFQSPTQPTMTFGPRDSFSNHIPNGPDSSSDGGIKTHPDLGDTGHRPCSELTPDLLDQVGKIVSNGTQMVELVTELVQMTSITLASTVEDLKLELDKLEEARARVTDVVIPAVAQALGRDDLSRGHGSGGESRKDSASASRSQSESVLLRSMANTTKAIFQIAEAIASNTGWIPYIFHNVQFVEGQVNKTIVLGQRLASDLLLVPEKVGEAVVRKAPCEGAEPEEAGPGEREGGGLTKGEWSVLQSVHATALKLERIMPALTHLIAEPEPLITLVGGQQPTEGRVEIYARGHWGTICDVTLGHEEAGMLCRQLGYFGGISADRGHFGPGSGLLWHFNKTCVQSFKCPMVSRQDTPEACSHETDFAVICDHMVRLEALGGSNDVSTGRVQIYHQGAWRGVCGAGWGVNEARVACRQLGYQTGRPVSGGRDPSDSFAAFVRHPQCRGDESSLHRCQWEDLRLSRCTARRHAAVTCQ